MSKKARIKSLEEKFRWWKSRYYREGAKLDRLAKKGLKDKDPKYNVQKQVTLIVLGELENAQEKLLQAKMAGLSEKGKDKIIREAEKKAREEKKSRKRDGKWTGHVAWTSKADKG